MPNSSMLKQKGLWTFSNYFTSVPEGALLSAQNTIIDRDGIIEPRRGIGDYGTVGPDASAPVKQLFIYKDRVLSYVGTQLWFDDTTGNFTSFTIDGTSSFTFTPQGIFRPKSIEAQGNFYFTTSDAVKKVSLASTSGFSTTPGSIPTVTFAGGVRAPDIQLSLDLTTPNGFLPPGDTVAYRVVWGTTDANGNLILGYPSFNAQILNTSSATGYGVKLVAQVPPQLIGAPGATNYFYQVYRSVVTATPPASDELNQVYEAPYDGVSTTITVFDNTPESIRNNGTPLYTNQYSGQGLTQANEPPPLCQDITLYKNFAFYANTQAKQLLNITMQGLDGFMVFNGESSNPNRITSITFGGVNSTFTLAGAGHLFPFPTTQQVVIFYQNATPPQVLTASFTGTNTFTLPGDFSAVSPSIVSVFASYIDVFYHQPQTSQRFFFVGRPTVTNLVFSGNKSSMASDSSFTITSANNVTNYLFWWKLTPTDLPPGPVPANTVLTMIDVSSASISTQAQVMDVTLATLEATGDFFAVESGSTLVISTNDSGSVTTAPAFFVTPGGGWTISQVLDGVGESITNHFIDLSSAASVGQAIELTTKSLIRVVDRNILELSLFYTSSVTDLPGNFSVFGTNFSTPEFFFVSNILNYTDSSLGTGRMFNPVFGTGVGTTAAFSTAEVNVNRVYYSKQFEPENVPSQNFFDVGPKDKAILRVIALRNTLFILKEEGIYSITGTDPTNFYLTLFDSSTILVAPDTAQVLNNQIYTFSSQGVATVTETGVGIVSRPIEDIFNRIRNSNFTFYNTASFGVAYESDRAYMIFTVFNTTDESATVAYRYNTFTQAWTSWLWNGDSAIVNPATSIDKLYIGSSTTNTVEVERKNLSRTDYADKSFPIEIEANTFQQNQNQIIVSSVENVGVGDIITQTQYVSEAQFNRLLAKLDRDNGLPTHNFQMNYLITPTVNMANTLFNLTTYLNGVNPIFTISSDVNVFPTIQSDFNTLIGELNNPSAPTLFKDYQLSTGTETSELLVMAFSFNNNSVSTNVTTRFIAGPATLYKAIPVVIQWAPMTFGDPGMLKHIREGTLMFQHDNLAVATFGYGSDLSPGFEQISFGLEGDGTWGNNTWNNFAWGGNGTPAPFRTLIPRQKQRCRFIEAQFTHNAAYYKFLILGISYVYEVTSTRAYR